MRTYTQEQMVEGIVILFQVTTDKPENSAIRSIVLNGSDYDERLLLGLHCSKHDKLDEIADFIPSSGLLAELAAIKQKIRTGESYVSN